MLWFAPSPKVPEKSRICANEFIWQKKSNLHFRLWKCSHSNERNVKDGISFNKIEMQMRKLTESVAEWQDNGKWIYFLKHSLTIALFCFSQDIKTLAFRINSTVWNEILPRIDASEVTVVGRGNHPQKILFIDGVEIATRTFWDSHSKHCHIARFLQSCSTSSDSGCLIYKITWILPFAYRTLVTIGEYPRYSLGIWSNCLTKQVICRTQSIR